MLKKNLKKISAIVLVGCMMVGAVAGCGKKPVQVEQADFKQAEYNTTTSVMPSNWNEFTYADNNDTQIMSYIGSSFFAYDYKFETDQKFNANLFFLIQNRKEVRS